ncbi:hypothetical protein A8L34_27840 [Bacillus sp. FJAT-27264]|uniref:DUF7167 family protein n=1 Tax=Paenibacillus sp. (strain DSM 101736 / FJAT-27264) TaxID=1850362 RepID=UPI000807C7C5|nr:hypothetical protein [Bacillus sp. FJAT-27264]OBZ15861.1 hypothetical protein A8L34_27840 [Bacillus sp. FJAT-27264]
MDPKTKVYFSLNIGFAGEGHEDEFTLEELGYNPENDTDMDKFLEEAYIEWRFNYLDGGWRFEK